MSRRKRPRRCNARIRLFPWELESMDEYSATIPTGQTLWKMWKCNLNDNLMGVTHTCGMEGTADARGKLSQVRCPKCSETGGFQRHPLPKKWIVGQYIPHRNPKCIGMRWHTVQVLQGPKPGIYNAPDWSNYQRWSKDRKAERAAERA